MLQALIEYWKAFFADFQRQGVVTQIGFLLPFLGLPSVSSFLLGRTSKRRLRSALEGSRNENALLHSEIMLLKRKSFAEALATLSGDDAADLSSLKYVFDDASFDVAEACENYARLKIAEAYSTENKASLSEARKFATVALELEPKRFVARLLLEETSIGDGESEPWFNSDPDSENVFAGTPQDGLEKTAALILEKVDALVRERSFAEANRLARRFLFSLTKEGLLETFPGALGKLALAKTIIHKHNIDENEPSDEAVRITEDLIKTAKRILPDNDHNYLAFLWHHTEALQIAGRPQDALQILENGKLLQRTRQYLGARANPTIACRHTYLTLLIEINRNKEALEQIRSFRSDLARWNMLDETIANRLDKWERALEIKIRQGQ